MKKAFIIGGGLAGSEASYYLLKKGYDVTLFEARPEYKDSAHYIDPYNAEINLDELLTQPVSDPKEILAFYSWEKTATLISGVVKNIL